MCASCAACSNTSLTLQRAVAIGSSVCINKNMAPAPFGLIIRRVDLVLLRLRILRAIALEPLQKNVADLKNMFEFLGVMCGPFLFCSGILSVRAPRHT